MMFILLMHMLLQLGTVTWSRADFAESPTFDVRETIAEFIQDLCPKVDICDVNATSAELRPNEIVSRGRVSCCQGCSCHPDCKEKDNCCYPGDYKSTNEPQPATSMTVCLYTRLGQPEMIKGFVPAYKTIVARPRGGCVDTRPIRITPNVVLHPTCDDIDVTPLGPYYPVFSRDTGTVYKNVLCARCHGIRNTESFLPNLVCKTVRKDKKAENSMTDFLNFLDTGFLTPECHVDFTFTDPHSLKDIRCYRDVIDTCTSQSISFPPGFNPPNLTFDVIQNLCESGLNSRTLNVENGVLYKNAFCSLCGKRNKYPVFLLCSENDISRTLGDSLTFILNAKMMHTINKAPGPKTKNEVCLTKKMTDEKPKEPEICKQVYCPTGKIRNEKGDCEAFGNYLEQNRGYANIKLAPKEPLNFGNESYEAFRERLVQGLLESKPWPEQWEVIKIFYRVNINSTKCDENAIAAILLTWDKTRTRNVYDDIEDSLQLPWLFEWNSKTYHLTQSFLEYKLQSTYGVMNPKLLPSWQHDQTNDVPKENYFKCGPMRWADVRVSVADERNVITVTKLFFCDQIQLRPDEFILGPKMTYLESNLTKRILHDREFDIVEDQEGSSARVCVDDTILVAKSTNEGSTLKTPVIVLVPLCMIALTRLE